MSTTRATKPEGRRRPTPYAQQVLRVYCISLYENGISQLGKGLAVPAETFQRLLSVATVHGYLHGGAHATLGEKRDGAWRTAMLL